MPGDDRPRKASRLARRARPGGLFALAGLACAACCAVPPLVAAGVVGGAGWAAADRLLAGLALALVAGAVTRWWVARRRRPHRCGAACACGRPAGGPASRPAGR